MAPIGFPTNPVALPQTPFQTTPTPHTIKPNLQVQATTINLATESSPRHTSLIFLLGPMGLSTLHLAPRLGPSYYGCIAGGTYGSGRVLAKIGGSEKKGEESKKMKKTSNQSLFSSVADALDFAQVRSVEDAQLLEDARQATRSGGRMSRQQYGALRRKIGGTYKDFFKSYVEVDGQYVEEGWVDKTCKVCKKDTAGEPRQVDKFGNYVHVACLDKSSQGNFFTRLFSR